MLIGIVTQYGRFGLMGQRLQDLLAQWTLGHRFVVQNGLDRIDKARNGTGRYFFANDPPYVEYDRFVAAGIVNAAGQPSGGGPNNANRGGRKRARPADEPADEPDDDDEEESENDGPVSIPHAMLPSIPTFLLSAESRR
jgi:hypothetical protein